MGVECAFRSDHPDVLAGWADGQRKAATAYLGEATP